MNIGSRIDSPAEAGLRHSRAPFVSRRDSAERRKQFYRRLFEILSILLILSKKEVRIESLAVRLRRDQVHRNLHSPDPN